MGFNPGGGGSSSISGSSDVTLNNVANNDVLAYDVATTKWKNKPPLVGQYPETRVQFSSLSGANDTAKLQAFRTFAMGQTTYHGIALELDEIRTYNFTAGAIQAWSGMCIVGGTGAKANTATSTGPTAQKISLGAGGGWITLPDGNIYGINLQGLSFDGSSTARVFEPNANCVVWTACFRDISMQNIASFLGSKAIKQGVTATTFDGWWNINNVREQAWHVGGSDCRFTMSNMLLDSPPSLLGDGEYLASFDFQEKTPIEHIFATAEQHSAFQILGSASQEYIDFRSCDIEGRNAGAPCYGALIRSSGFFTMDSCRLAYAMSDPGTGTGSLGPNGRWDRGYIHMTSGGAYLNNIKVIKATGVADSVPLVYVGSGAKLRIQNVLKMGTWTGANKPIVLAEIPSDVVADDTVTVVQA